MNLVPRDDTRFFEKKLSCHISKLPLRSHVIGPFCSELWHIYTTKNQSHSVRFWESESCFMFRVETCNNCNCRIAFCIAAGVSREQPIKPLSGLKLKACSLSYLALLHATVTQQCFCVARMLPERVFQSAFQIILVLEHSRSTHLSGRMSNHIFEAVWMILFTVVVQ